MKTRKIKVLFTLLLFLAVVPSVTQAVGDASLKTDSNMLKWASKYSKRIILRIGFVYLEWRLLEKMYERWSYHQLKEEVEKEADDCRKDLLAKVDTGELVKGSSSRSSWSYGLSYCLTSLNLEEVEKVRESLYLLKISKSFAGKILILGMEYEDCSESGEIIIAVVLLTDIDETYDVPYAILIDNQFLAKSSPFEKQFTFLHEAGHVKSHYLGVYEPNNKELNEVIADTYALDVVARLTKKDDFKNLAEDLYSVGLEKPYLSPEELVYHGEQLFAAQEKENKLDVLTYARKIVAERKEDGYKERVAQGARRLGLQKAV